MSLRFQITMSTIFRSCPATEPRSGGKMVRPRRAAGARTPYERPRLANPKPENPNWLSRLIYSSTRTIATGAGKLLTNVFFPESSSSESESSSASSSADDSSSGMCVFLYTVMSTVRTIRFFFLFELFGRSLC